MSESKSNSSRRIFSQKEREIVLSKTNGICAHCGKRLTVDTMTIDHIFPMDKGGLNDEYNLLPLCESCNIEKSNFVYSLDDWYKYIVPEEYDNIDKYYNYASFEYRQKSLIGFDAVCFKFVPHQYYKMIHNTGKRRMKQNAYESFVSKLMTSLLLTKAYPGEYEKIFEFLQKLHEKYSYPTLFYQNAHQLLEDIETGCVYVLESREGYCGVFAFKDISTIKEDVNIPQLTSSAECLGYKLKYIMTCAVINRFAKDVYNDVMMYLENTQINRGYFPVYLNILNRVHKDQDQFIIMPFTINDIATKVEFMPISYIRESRVGHVKHLFVENGYDSVLDYEVDYFLEALFKYSYEYEYENDKEMLAFLDKYPLLKLYFKPNEYKFYDIGFKKMT